MSAANAVLLTPIEITSAMIKTGTSVPVVDTSAGEVAWDAGETVTTGMRRNYSGSIWEAVADNTGVAPDSDATKWLRFGPSNRMAPFDAELNTVTRRTSDITYVLHPKFFTGLGIYGMVGEHLNVKLYDEPSGTIVEQYDGDLFEQAMGLYELLFMPLKIQTQFYMQALPIYPDAELRISITSAGGGAVEVAMISLGNWDTLIGSGPWGGVEYGAEARVKSYSYLKRNDDGTVTRKRRGSANDVNCSITLPIDEANHAMGLLHSVQGVPVAFIASGLPQYEFLNGFGDVSGGITAENYGVARMQIKIEGAVQGVKP